MKNGTIKNVTVSTFTRRPATSIITRGVLIEPTLYLAFPRKMMAHIASSQHLCLCRNEDVLLPGDAYKVTIGEWHSDLFPGFEFTFGKDSAPQVNVGLNRYADA